MSISQKEINQYSDFQIWQLKDTASELLKALNEKIVEKCKSISYETINQQIMQLNTEFVRLYEEKYRALLQLTGSTFEAISIETQQQADYILSFGRKNRHAAIKSSNKKEGTHNDIN